tara:strand:- start:1034 stop:1759 length:726 start_codon:yes stop_codon:yes gene_type:complete
LGDEEMIFSPTGGLSYHLRAFRYKRNLWSPFISQVHSEIQSWKSPGKALLLIGPNAGYSLPLSYLSQWEKIEVLEPDPIARFFLKKKLGLFSYNSRDFFFDLEDESMDYQIVHLFEEYSDYDWIFCNFLGQLQSLYPESKKEIHPHWIKTFQDLLLKKNHWFSYHDLFSAPQKPKIEAIDSQKFISYDDFIRRVYSTERETLYINDHQTWKLFEPFPLEERRWASWEIHPAYTHIIEFRHG